MNSKSKTKKLFADPQQSKQTEPASLTSLMRRFKSHDIYSTLKQAKPKKSTQNTKMNERTTITINLNLPHSNLNISNWGQSNKNNKRVFSEKRSGNSAKNKPSFNDWHNPNYHHKESASLNHYTHNTTRMRNQMDTMKILNEESIQELDTEENCKPFFLYNIVVLNGTEDNNLKKYDINPDSYFSNSINEISPSKESKEKHIAHIPQFQNKFQEEQQNNLTPNRNCRGESCESNPNRQLILAAKKGDKETVLELIDCIINKNKGNGLNFQDENGWNALHYACDEGNLKIVEILMKTNIDLNCKTNDKKTPLHLASSHGYFDISKLLIEHDAIINAHDNEKNTPIHLCTMTNHLELLKFLCDRSKSLSMKNIYGKTPMDLATKEETKNLLKQYLSKPSVEMLNVKIHTTNTKQANTLIKHINCQGYKTPSKYVNNEGLQSQQNLNHNESKILYTTTNSNSKYHPSQHHNSYSTNNNIRPTTAKTKFNNNVQNNNININISTNLCNISHQNSKQFKVPERVNVIVDGNTNNNARGNKGHNYHKSKHSTINTNALNNSKWINEQKPLPTTHKSSNQIKQKLSAKMKNESTSHSQNKNNTSHNNINNKQKDICSYSSVPKFNNVRGTSQNVTKSKKLFNHKASSMPHKEDINTQENDTTIVSHNNNSKGKEMVYPMKIKEKPMSSHQVLNVGKKDSENRVANVEISLDQLLYNQSNNNPYQTHQKEEALNDNNSSGNDENEDNTDKQNNLPQITSVLNLTDDEDDDDNDGEENEDEDNDNNNEEEEERDQTEQNNTELNSVEEERIGPSTFNCLALLGKGSFGEVYLVQKKNSDDLYAMKVLDKDKIMGQNIVKYAMTERNVLSLTSHPFIVKLNYAFQTNDKLFLLLDYCSNGDLSEQLTKETRFDEERAKIYLCEIILALGDLHQKNIIFRDLKPDNVVLDIDGHAMLTDFGLSREGVFNAKIAKSFCGSIAYLAPEMLQRKGHGKAVDWYLLGVLFYEMLVGIPPFFTNNKEQIFKNIQTGELQIPRCVSQKAAKLLRLLLKKDPNARLGSKNDVEEIKANEYFKDVNWDSVYNRELKPPIPKKNLHPLQKFKQPKVFNDNEEAVDDNNTLQQKFEGWSFVQNNNNTTINNNTTAHHNRNEMK